MKRFKYKAKDKQGVLVTGIVESSNLAAASKLVRGRGLIVISISPVRELPIALIKRIRDRVGGEDITNFTRQLATMVAAGLPLTEALLILRSQAKGVMQKVVGQILADVEEGESLSSAMAKHPNAFSKTYIALIKTGELGGALDTVLLRLSENLEKQQEFQGKVKSAMVYPAIITFGMIIVIAIMLIFVVPRLTSLYDQFDAELPISTKILIGVSSFAVNFWPVILVMFGVGVWGLKLYNATKKGKRRVDELLFKIPIIGGLRRQVVLTDLTHTLGMMVGNGVSILEGLNISAEVVSSVTISDALLDSSKMVEKGFPVAFAFSRHPEAFPFILSQMVAVGEETGKMDEVLEKVSHIFEVESEQKIKALTSAVEPIILLFLGVGVAFLAISVILPIYNLTTQF